MSRAFRRMMRVPEIIDITNEEYINAFNIMEILYQIILSKLSLAYLYYPLRYVISPRVPVERCFYLVCLEFPNIFLDI